MYCFISSMSSLLYSEFSWCSWPQILKDKRCELFSKMSHCCAEIVLCGGKKACWVMMFWLANPVCHYPAHYFLQTASRFSFWYCGSMPFGSYGLPHPLGVSRVLFGFIKPLGCCFNLTNSFCSAVDLSCCSQRAWLFLSAASGSLVKADIHIFTNMKESAASTPQQQQKKPGKENILKLIHRIVLLFLFLVQHNLNWLYRWLLIIYIFKDLSIWKIKLHPVSKIDKCLPLFPEQRQLHPLLQAVAWWPHPNSGRWGQHIDHLGPGLTDAPHQGRAHFLCSGLLRTGH